MTFIEKCKQALRAFLIAVKEETHLKVHLMIAVIVTVVGFLSHLYLSEWITLIFCFGIVISAELFNTAIERLCDLVNSNYSEKIKWIKDIASMAVLTVSIMAAVIGILILVSHFV